MERALTRAWPNGDVAVLDRSAFMSVTSVLASPREPGQLRPLRDIALGTMPVELNTFVGREDELAKLRELLRDARLLSLVGPGGVGKTRLALRLGADHDGAFPDGAWLLDPSPISNPALVPQQLADMLDVPFTPRRSSLHELTRALRSRQLLLVLDNCEHLIESCAELAEGLLRGCPNLRVLATSLHPLGVQGGVTWRVAPLSLLPAAVRGPEDLVASEAVRLFVTRVQAQLQSFAPTEHNAAIIGEICRRLDGLPLALELVAARVESLGSAEVAARLNDRFGLAVRAEGSAPTRQHTLQATLEWSWSLLTATEMTLLRRLAVFVGGWTLQAAEAVCADRLLARETVVDTLGQLVSKSLVVADHDRAAVRYRHLETIREYALLQLESASETAVFRRRHAAYMLQLAENAPTTQLDFPEVSSSLTREEDNLRTALECAASNGEAEFGLRLATAMYGLWLTNGHYVEGNRWLDRLLAACPPSAVRSLALTRSAQLRIFLGDYSGARAHAQEALAERKSRGDVDASAVTLNLLGRVAQQRGDLVAADELHTQSARQLREIGSPHLVDSLLQSAVVATEIGSPQRVRELIAEIVAIGDAPSEQLVPAGVLHLEALLAARLGDTARAARLVEQEVAVRRARGAMPALIKSLTILGHVRLDLIQRPEALDAFVEAIQLAHTSGERVRLIRALEGFARWLSTARADTAVRLVAASDAQRRTLGAVMWPSERRYLEGWLNSARRTLGNGGYARAWEDGQASSPDQAIAMAEAVQVESLHTSSVTSTLTAREQQVAVLLAKGLTNKQVAAALTVSPGTVRSHVEHILIKLELRSRAQIAVWATEQRLLGAP
jgi:predicted ATPase/DNA-binding CsgD family transcriptional regulator